MQVNKKALRKAAEPKISFAQDTAPPERWQHSDYVAVPTGQRVKTGVMQLATANKISGREVVAADRWYRDYALGAERARDPEAGGGSGGHDAFPVAVIDALTRYREASQAVGLFGDSLLRMFVADGMSLATMARRLDDARGVDSREISGRDLTGAMVATLVRLGEHYNELDSRRGRLPSYEFSRLRSERRAAV